MKRLAVVVLLLACQRQAPPAPAPQPAQPTMPSTLHVLTLGDSLAYGAGDETGKGIAGRLEDELPSVHAVNLGVNGAQTSDLAARLKQKRVRDEVARADAIVLSIGANDLFRTPGAREETLRNPIPVANRILDRIVSIVAELHAINPRARVLLLGGYNPVPTHPNAAQINQYLGVWDLALAARFETDSRVDLVKMSDIVVPAHLSRYDHFHPGGEAYRAAAKRIAEMLLDQPRYASANSSA